MLISETQSIIKSQKTDATFGEISKIVASMWDGLGESEKTVSKGAAQHHTFSAAALSRYVSHVFFLIKK